MCTAVTWSARRGIWLFSKASAGASSLSPVLMSYGQLCRVRRLVRLDVDAMNARDLVVCWRVIGKARVAQAGSDGDDSPVPRRTYRPSLQ
jgi:hypothetical protein